MDSCGFRQKAVTYSRFTARLRIWNACRLRRARVLGRAGLFAEGMAKRQSIATHGRPPPHQLSMDNAPHVMRARRRPAAMCFLEFSGNLQHTRHHVMTNPGSREDNKTHYLYALPHWLNAPGPARVRRFLFILFNRQFTSQEEAPASTALTTSQHDGGLTALARLRWRLSTTTRLHPTDSGPSTF